MARDSSRARFVAVLGPTNTGKTHLAMERMLGHSSGMIGFPLRLLARENFDRAVRIKGAGQVALITGEEKIVPPGARYFLCTVESMPVDRPVAFLGVDEVQMCADPDRGHVFTDRLLHARGQAETMFMGADTIRPILRRLVPGIEFLSRPRFSTLTYTGERKITRLPRRSVTVAFSAADVYAIAELVRRQRGGGAVVLGALSPRTRNAQVAMYQAGEVDYLIATDAVGMGLNMDVDHVAFAATRKFDGRVARALTASELAQIAGRAGRHMNDGTFGTTGDVGPLDADTVARIESHTFEPLRFLYWRNPELRFVSLGALKASLARAPDQSGLVRAREADDELALAALAHDPDVAAMTAHPAAVRLLWEVCQIPDFRKVMSDAHARLLGRIYRHLMSPAGLIPTDWMAAQVERLDRTDGDIETIAQRIAGVRIWTYVAYRGDWLDDAAHWQERARALEDRLSDTLHERLTQRFVDRRTAHLVRRLKDRDELVAAVTRAGEVVVEGHYVGRLEGFRFVVDAGGGAVSAKAAAAAAMRALVGEASTRVRRLEDDGDDAFALAGDGRVLWRGEAVARLVAGAGVLAPAVESLASDLLEAGPRERVRARLQSWLAGHLGGRLKPLYRLAEAPLEGAARGIAFQLAESLGSLPRRLARDQIAALDRPGRRALARLGVRVGRESVYLPALLKPRAMALRGLLHTVFSGLAEPTEMPSSGRISVPAGDARRRRHLEAMGFRPFGDIAVRVDMVERLAEMAWRLARDGPFAPAPELAALAGCDARALAEVLGGLGFRTVDLGDGVRFLAGRAERSRHGRHRRPRVAGSTDSPFAKLRELTPGR